MSWGPLLQQALIKNHTLTCLFLGNRTHLQVPIFLAAQRKKIWSWSLKPGTGQPHTKRRNTKVNSMVEETPLLGSACDICLCFTSSRTNGHRWQGMKTHGNAHPRSSCKPQRNRGQSGEPQEGRPKACLRVAKSFRFASGSMSCSVVPSMTCSSHATHQRTDFRASLNIFIEHLLCTPDTDPGAGNREDRRDKIPALTELLEQTH